MWISDRHPDRDRLLAAQAHGSTSVPPEASGRELALFDRPGFGRKPDARMRLSLDQFEGHAFLSLRLWQKGSDGQFYPTRTGTSIRIGEGEEMAAAILEGVRLAHAGPAGPSSTELGHKRSVVRRARPAAERVVSSRPPLKPLRAEDQPDFYSDDDGKDA